MPASHPNEFVRVDKQFTLMMGHIVGRWRIVGGPVAQRLANGRTLAFYPCLCTCGTAALKPYSLLAGGRSRSCGCLHREKMRARQISHGDSNTRLYEVWANMKSRCGNPNSSAYHCYGGRGITICEEWLASFAVFREWSLSNGYQDDLSIDRVDVNGNYEPGNCRWITMREQRSTTRKCVFLTAFGETKTLNAWARDSRCAVTLPALRTRLKLGWSDQDAVGKPRTESAVNNPTGRGGFAIRQLGS